VTISFLALEHFLLSPTKKEVIKGYLADREKGKIEMDG
jgi:hypothetical protein